MCCSDTEAQVQNVLGEGFGGLVLKPGLVLSRNLLPPGETNREDQPGSQSPPTFNVRHLHHPKLFIVLNNSFPFKAYLIRIVKWKNCYNCIYGVVKKIGLFSKETNG